VSVFQITGADENLPFVEGTSPTMIEGTSRDREVPRPAAALQLQLHRTTKLPALPAPP